MKTRTMKRAFNLMVVTLLTIGLIAICSKFIHFGRVEYTDNAQTKQLIVPVNSRIQGFLKKIYFEEYSPVKKGDTLALIEDMEYRYRLAQAMADYQNALAGHQAMNTGISTTTNNLLVSDAGIEEAKILLEHASTEYQRYSTLYEQNAVTKQQFDAVSTTYRTRKARYDQLVRQKASTSLVKQEQTERLKQSDANIKLAEAALELARLNLSYTIIVAPCDGITGRNMFQEGQLVQPGQTIVDLVDMNDRWIIANFKEHQIAHIAAGMPVKIKVDAIPGTHFSGHVKAISKATGASFSTFPQDNSSGNFIKVEQRIPVRIEFTEDNNAEDMKQLRAGMNVECEVKY